MPNRYAVRAKDTHQSAIRLKPLTGEVNPIDYLVTMAPVKEWDSLGSKVRVPVLTPVHSRKSLLWVGPWSRKKKVHLRSDASHFLLNIVDRMVIVRHLTREKMAQGCTIGGREANKGE